MMDSAPTLSIVIVSYNTQALLRQCLASLMTEGGEWEVIVVDNASSDGSPAMVAQEFPHVQLLAQTENRWYCEGNNIGAAQANGSYVLFLNPDTVVRPGSLEAMIAFMDTHPDYAGATCQLRYPNGTIQRTCSRRISLSYLIVMHSLFGMLPFVRNYFEQRYWYPDWQRDTDHDVDAVPGSCTLVRKADAQMDANLLLYFPEDELAQRLQRPFRFLSSVYIEHHEKSSTMNWRAKRIYFRDLIVYTRSQFGVLGAAVVWLTSRPLFYGMWLKQHLGRP